MRFLDDELPNNDVYIPLFGVEAEVTEVVVVEDDAVELRVSESSVTSSSLELDSLMYRGSSSRRRDAERGELKLHLLSGLSFAPETTKWNEMVIFYIFWRQPTLSIIWDQCTTILP